MLIQESELNTYNSDAIIDEAVILDESESIIKLPAIPVVENSRLDCGLVHINDLDSIVEDYDCSYEDAFCAIAEQNELDPNSLAVVVEDYSIIETPELVDLVPNIVVKPISEDNAIYQFCDYAVSALNEGYLTEEEFNDIMLDELSLKGIGHSISNWAKGVGKTQASENPIADTVTAKDKSKQVAAQRKESNTAAAAAQSSGEVPGFTSLKQYTQIRKASKVPQPKKEHDRLDMARKKWDVYTDNKSTKSTPAASHTEPVKKQTIAPSAEPAKKPTASNNNGNFLSNHKTAVGLGIAGVAGAALAARKIAALHKQQKKYPGLRGKIQNVINKLKAKLHR